MRGTRVQTDVEMIHTPGSYWKTPGGEWHCNAPTGDLIGNLVQHTVIEHEDGTISVSPSILITGHHGHSYHGFLERGEWRDA